MRAYDAGRWLFLAILWSLPYIFMRVAVPAFGIAPVAGGRALFAAAFLLPWAVLFARQRIGLRELWKDHLAVSLVNNVLPFVGFAIGAAALPASYLAVINGLVPLWAAVIAVPVLGPVAYYAFGRSPIQGSLRLMLVVGGLVIYVALAALGVLLA